MFLELSFNSRADSKKMSGSRAASSWRYDHEDKEEMSLDELISDFQQSTSRLSKLKGSVSGSDVSPLRIASPPKRSKTKERNEKSRSFTDRARAVKQEPVKRTSAKNMHHHDSSDDEGAVSPMPRIEQVLKNKPTFIRKCCGAAASPARRRPAPIQRRKPGARSPVLSSSSLSPSELSPLTSSSSTSSPLSKDTHISATPEEDSIDALIGKDIRDLNKLILSGRKAARSPRTDDMSNVIRQSTRFRREESKRSRSPLRLHIPKRKSRSTMLESPPPPPPPDDEEDEEDSFAEEIRKLRESRRLSSMPAKAPEKETPKEEVKPENSDTCTTTALEIRNASNAISDLLFEAMKPFEDRQREQEDKTNTTKEENCEGDAVIRDAMMAELQTATQTIVSHLDLTFADMTERRNADLKAEAEATAAAKEEEKKEKEAADEKKKTEDKETKEREMEILRLLPMQGKLLACSADIETVLTQLEKTDTAMQDQLADNTLAIDAEIRALRNHTQRKIQEIEARMSAVLPRENQSEPSNGVLWRAVDWVHDNFAINQQSPLEQRGSHRPEGIQDVDTEDAPAESEGRFEEVLQRQVLEKLDLTILKLKHVLAIDTKEAAEAKERQLQEKEEQARIEQQQQLEEQQGQRELEDAENARRRVMGLTSVDEVDGWIEEGQQLRDALGHDRSLNRLVVSLERRMNLETSSRPTTYLKDLPPNQEEVLRHFDRLNSAMAAQESAENSDEEGLLEHGDLRQNIENRPVRRQKGILRMHESKQPRWIEVVNSESDDDSENSGSNDDNSGRLDLRPIQRSERNHHRRIRSPLRTRLLSPVQRPRHLTSSSDNRLRRYPQDVEDFNNKQKRDVRFSSKSKRGRRKNGASRLQVEVARTIQAFQAERRQKTSWIQKHSRRPLKQEAPFCNPVIF